VTPPPLPSLSPPLSSPSRANEPDPEAGAVVLDEFNLNLTTFGEVVAKNQQETFAKAFRDVQGIAEQQVHSQICNYTFVQYLTHSQMILS